MKDDYLWDKSGKPDPDVQQLEEILGTLRYQQRELEIPQHIQLGRKSFITRGLAIAAAVALIALALGVWINMKRQSTPKMAVTETTPAAVDNSIKAAAGPDEKKLSNLLAQAPETDKPSRKLAASKPRRRLAFAGNRAQDLEAKEPELSESEIAEARVAKDQLMLALRVASSKLNLAQKKAQGTNSANEIHNQHKTG